MTTISGLSLPSVADASATQTQNTTDTSSLGLGNIGESDFLKLLVAQLQNQDPLSPMDNTAFVTQLATFSSLEQLVSINQAVTKLAGSTQVTPSI